VNVRLAASLLLGLTLAFAICAAGPRRVAAADCLFWCETLTIQLDPASTGTGTISDWDGYFSCRIVDGKIQSGSVCSHYYSTVEVSFPYTVNLEMVPAPGNYYCHPYPSCGPEDLPDDYSTSVDPPYQTNVQKTVTIGFRVGSRSVNVAVEPFAGGQGTIASSPVGISCPSACSATFNYGTDLSLTAKPLPGSAFDHWAGVCAGQGATCHVTLVSGQTLLPETPPPFDASAVFVPASATPTPAVATSRPATPTATQPSPSSIGPRPTGVGPTPGPAATSASAGLPSPGSTASLGPMGSPPVAAAGSTILSGSSTVGEVGAIGPANPTDLTPVVLAIVVGTLLIALAIVTAALLGRSRAHGEPSPPNER